MRRVAEFVIKRSPQLERRRTEPARLDAEIATREKKLRELQAALDAQMDQVMAREQKGMVVALPASITGRR